MLLQLIRNSNLSVPKKKEPLRKTIRQSEDWKAVPGCTM